MSIEEDAAILADLPIFNLLEREAVRLLAFQADKQDLSIDEIVIEPEQKADGGLVLLSGKLAIETQPETADQINSSAKILTTGALIGKLALITEVTHRIRARAIEPASILKIKRTSFQRILREYPECAAKIRAAIASDLMHFTKALEASRK